MRRRTTAGAAAAALSLWLAACASSSRGPGAIGEAYAGPSEVVLRADIPLDSRTVAKVKHGDRLQILEQRRGVFFRVRAPNGAEGWTDARQLLTSDEMAGLRALAERSRNLTSQGAATTSSDLRVHTSPSRTAPSFNLLKENDKADVLGYLAAPRTGSPRQPLLPPAPPPIKKTKKKADAKPEKPPQFPPPPRPKPPGPPDNWLELSQPTLAQARGAEPDEDEPDPQPAEATDLWALVRTASGECGWALARALVMAIPDEVAQYAERHRIVAYFPLGETRDGDEVKNDWLWTTAGSGNSPYDFESFRVFIWSIRRHRYETAHIEHDLKGFLPVRLGEVEFSTGTKGKRQSARYRSFSVCVERANGERRWREYAFLDPTVRFVGETPCEPAPPLMANAPAPGPAAPAPAAKKESFGERAKRWFKAITPRWFSK